MVKIPIFEYRCLGCGNIDEKLEFGSEMDEKHYCSKCNSESKRIMSKNRCKLVYNNKTDMCTWSNEGYASSQYWREYKKAKERGENVKPYGED